MSEPFYIRQSAPLAAESDRLDWLKACVAEANAEGSRFARASVHPTHAGVCLYEAWKERPEDQGEQRWQSIT